MKIIGPTFSDELMATGLDMNGVSWSAGGEVWFNDAVPQATRDAVMAVYAAHDPNTSAVTVDRRNASNDIDAAAGAARARYVTVAPGQEMTYIIKAQQAGDYRKAGYPVADIVDYPFVAAKAKAIAATPTPTAADYQLAADAIYNRMTAWYAIGAEIERAREAGKAAVSAATTADAIASARAAAIAALKVM